MTEVYCLKIDKDITDEQINCLKKIITEENSKRIEKLRFKTDVLRTLYGELLVRYTVSKFLGLDTDKIKIRRDKFNKPYFLDLPLHFNISHSGDYVVCAVSSHSIGIDIEEISNIDINIAQKFFSKDEWEYLLNLDPPNRKSAFFELWTIKESYIKFIGKGMYMPLNSFSVNLNDMTKTIAGETMAYFHQYEFSGYKCAVCSGKIEIPENINYIPAEDILCYFEDKMKSCSKTVHFNL